MTVTNGQLANQTTFNNAFLSRTSDTSTTGRIDLNNILAASGPTISNVQREINSLNSFTGRTSGSAFNATPPWVNNQVGLAGDDLFDRSDALTERFDGTSGHTHDGTDGEGPQLNLASAVMGTLPIANGGTGQTTQTAAFDALSPTTTKGDLIVHDGTDNIRVAVGTDGFVLTADSGAASGVSWQAASGAGGGSFVWMVPDSNSPQEAFVSGVPVLDFWYQDEQEIYAYTRVPDSYTPGVQITLIGLLFASAATTGQVLFRTQTFLIEPGSSVLGSLANSHTSTNTEVTVSGVANTITAVGTVQLTDGSGMINGVPVAAGDQLAVKLIRDSSGETSSATNDARLLRYSGSPKFTA